MTTQVSSKPISVIADALLPEDRLGFGADLLAGGTTRKRLEEFDKLL